MKAPGFNPCTYPSEKPPVSNVCFQMQLVPLQFGVDVSAAKDDGTIKRGGGMQVN
jgi:hypothetical protein